MRGTVTGSETATTAVESSLQQGACLMQFLDTGSELLESAPRKTRPATLPVQELCDLVQSET
jgi:hypothetical protein